MGTLTGLPDFGRPHTSGTMSAFVAYEQPTAVAAVPVGLAPAPAGGGSGPLLIDVYLQQRDDRVEEFAVVTAAFVLDVPLDATQPDGRGIIARPAPLGDAELVLTAPDDLGLPAAALEPRPLDAAVGCSLPAVIRLDGVAAELLIGAVAAGLQALGAVAWVTVRGVAARCPGILEVDVNTLQDGIGSATVTPAELAARAAGGLPGVVVRGGPDDDRLRATCILDRIATRLARPAFGPQTDAGWAFADITAGQPTMTWDLTAPTAALRLSRLVCDPVLGDGAEHVVRRHTAPPLTDGRERITVYTTIPSPPGGVVAATVRLTAPPVLPERPFVAEATARIQPPAPAEVTLALAAGEPLVYDLAASAVMDTSGGPRALTGPPRRVVQDRTPVITPADLGLRLLSVTASEALLQRADVGVRATAARDGDTVESYVALLPEARQAWLALPRDAETVTLHAEATTHGPGTVTVRQQLPDAAVWLDPYSFDDPPWPLPGSQQDTPVVVEAAGLRAVGRRGAADWQFLPLTAGPVLDGAGKAQVSLIEAGAVAAIMVTTALRVTDAQLAQAREACMHAGADAAVRLSPAPSEVAEAALMVLRDGTLTTVASAVPSGTVTQDAAFMASLDAADLVTVRRALAGEAGLTAVRYLLRVSAAGLDATPLAGGALPVAVVTDASTWIT